ncbi:hypothetical protein DXA60_16455 [Roseburia sp. OF03-24]|nr:hypothetical protein DXA60_16455 [Roseburia sp. OF03-24]
MQRAADRNRRILIDHATALLIKQEYFISAICNGNIHDPGFTIEISHFLTDYVFKCILKGTFESERIEKAHLWLVMKYPELFEIYNTMENKASLTSRMQKWEDVEENRVKRFELENGDVWEKYVVWRQKAEREGKTPYETDCIFEETRSTFSIWCHLKNRIPFEIMLFYERCYEKIRRGVAGVSMMDDLKIFEEQNGSLQEEYNAWRRHAERSNLPQYKIDCAFQEARKNFSVYCSLKETIPFLVMCRYELIYNLLEGTTM